MTAVPDPAVQPTMTVPETARALGVSRATAYEAARSGQIPTIKVGRRLLVPTAAIRRRLLLDEEARIA